MILPPFTMSARLISQRLPFRLRVLRNLCALIERVNPDNGSAYDLRGSVFRGRDLFGINDPIPMVSVLEAPIPLEAAISNNSNQNSTGQWELLIQGFTQDDPINPTDQAHHLMAEVKSVLVKEKGRNRGRDLLDMGNRVADMYVGQGSVRPPDDVSDKAFFWLTLTLRLGEDLADPYK